MSGVHVSLSPMDMALFRDGRSFDAVDAQGARLLSLLPPPLTVYGALRQAILHEARIPYQEFRNGRGTDELGAKPDVPGSLAIGAIAVSGFKKGVDEEVRLLPLPADLVKIASRTFGEEFYGYQLPGEGAEQTNLPEGLSLLRPQRTGEKWTFTYELDKLALNAESLETYLTGQPGPVLPEIGEYLGREKRIGLERQAATLTAKQGRLYAAEFVRPFAATGYLVDLLAGGDDMCQSQFPFAIGGERRPFGVERRAYGLFKPDLRASVERALLGASEPLAFRLYLLSPALSSEGPDGWKPKLPAGYEIFAAAVPRCVWRSGWNTVANKPKAARPCVPAGAVYFVRAPRTMSRQEAVADVLSKFWYRPALCSDQESLEAKAGHGITLVGAIAHAN